MGSSENKKKRGRKPKAKAENQQKSPTAASSTSGGSKGKRISKQQQQQQERADKYAKWKQVIPLIDDWFTNHNLEWPSLSCRWGPQVEQATYKNIQRLYFSEQTDGSFPNTLVVANCEIVKPRVASAEHITNINEEAASPFIRNYKTIIHPGEVNRIRELPQNSKIVATHTDSPYVLIWDVEAQPNCNAVPGAKTSRPDLILTGHNENAEFALAMCHNEPFVLSGGKDNSVILWSIQDHIASSTTESGGSNFNNEEGNDEDNNSPSVGPRGIYNGHEETVEDVQFCPSSAQEFCSVGDDSCLIFWDARVGTGPVVKVEKAHNADIHCVDWNRHDSNLILTGSADNSIHLFDRRNLSSNGIGLPIYKFKGHEAAVLCVQWSPHRSSVFGSSAEDSVLKLWDHEKVGKITGLPDKASSSPSGLMFQHVGHRDKVVDFHWNAYDPWTVVSVSEDGETTGGGGTLQVWRISDLLHKPEEEALAELTAFKRHVQACGPNLRVD